MRGRGPAGGAISSRPVSTHEGALPGLAGAIRRAAIGAVDFLLTWNRRARERHLLAALDEARLKDIGISRADVEREAAKPFWRD